ncbi:hypothetical protein B0H66DRAFT_555315 [Apodospora peruviana]|uniref:Uncharacterized protein n=1 Tax=Apodospora peruviana TaxID=516989 RepID=A0AAE0ID23_9PEZI|nr:hypothetical protein B0H66DRAFT_555315 [Apodospora peruviana]
MASPHSSDRGVVTLESLPGEIISAILDFLVPQPPEIGETRPVGYDKLVPGEPWFDLTRSRRGLWSLCLVSRNFEALSRPLLYRVISILNEESMVLLLRTLVERPELGLATRYFSCHLTLSRNSVTRESRRALVKLASSFRDSPGAVVSYRTSAFWIYIREMVQAGVAQSSQAVIAADWSDIPQLIMAYILSRLSRLETLLLQVPICDDQPEYVPLLYELVAISAKFPASPMYGCRDHPHHGPYLPSIPVPEVMPFQHIGTLLMQGDPELREHFENDECNCEIPESWGVQTQDYYKLFTLFHKLHTLEVSTDDGNWRAGIDGLGDHTPELYLKGFRHIYLHGSASDPIGLYHLLLNASDLETLYMTPRRDDGYFHVQHESGGHAHPEAFDVALEKHAKHLRHLDVVWDDLIGGSTTVIGPEGRLASLPTLTKLEKLCVQLAVVYGGDLELAGIEQGRDTVEPETLLGLLPPLADLLPPNLVELTLEDWWWSNLDDFEMMDDWDVEQRLAHYRSKKDYRETAIKILRRFASDSTHSQPKLKKVLLLCKIPWTWMVEGGVPLDFHFEEVREAFAERGVEFLVDEAC